MRDLRDNPHSGYRAVHVWLRLPGGRVEVQIRTVGQSAWANTYERIGDLLGRGIRYNEMPEDQGAREIVELMHQLADTLARNGAVQGQTCEDSSGDEDCTGIATTDARGEEGDKAIYGDSRPS